MPLNELRELAAARREKLAVHDRYRGQPRIGGTYASVQHEAEWTAACRRHDAAVEALEAIALALPTEVDRAAE
jgi:hypothetical protein